MINGVRVHLAKDEQNPLSIFVKWELKSALSENDIFDFFVNQHQMVRDIVTSACSTHILYRSCAVKHLPGKSELCSRVRQGVMLFCKRGRALWIEAGGATNDFPISSKQELGKHMGVVNFGV